MKGAKYSETLDRLLSVTKSKNETDLAAALGIKPQSVWQAKQKDRVPAQWFPKISIKYGVSVDWLISGRESEAGQQNCQRCMELLTKLVQVQERENALLKENKAQEKEIGELKAKNAALEDRLSLFADSAADVRNTA